MYSNGKDTKHTKHTSRTIHFVINCEGCNLHKTVWCDGSLHLAYIVTKNVMEDELNTRLGYAMV